MPRKHRRVYHIPNEQPEYHLAYITHSQGGVDTGGQSKLVLEEQEICYDTKTLCAVRPGTDHAILSLRGTTKQPTRMVLSRYYSYLKNSLEHHLSVYGRIWSMGDELGA